MQKNKNNIRVSVENDGIWVFQEPPLGRDLKSKDAKAVPQSCSSQCPGRFHSCNPFKDMCTSIRKFLGDSVIFRPITGKSEDSLVKLVEDSANKCCSDQCDRPPVSECPPPPKKKKVITEFFCPSPCCCPKVGLCSNRPDKIYHLGCKGTSHPKHQPPSKQITVKQKCVPIKCAVCQCSSVEIPKPNHKKCITTKPCSCQCKREKNRKEGQNKQDEQSACKQNPCKQSSCEPNPCKQSSCEPNPCKPILCKTIPCKPIPCRPITCKPITCKPIMCKSILCKPFPCKAISCKPISCKPIPCKPTPCKPIPCKVNPCCASFCCSCDCMFKKEVEEKKEECCPAKDEDKDDCCCVDDDDMEEIVVKIPRRKNKCKEEKCNQCQQQPPCQPQQSPCKEQLSCKKQTSCKKQSPCKEQAPCKEKLSCKKQTSCKKQSPCQQQQSTDGQNQCTEEEPCCNAIEMTQSELDLVKDVFLKIRQGAQNTCCKEEPMSVIFTPDEINYIKNEYLRQKCNNPCLKSSLSTRPCRCVSIPCPPKSKFLATCQKPIFHYPRHMPRSVFCPELKA